MTNDAEPPAAAVPPPRPLDEEVVTLQEMVDLFGAKHRITVDQWVQRRKTAANKTLAFPEEDDHVGDKPVWRLERIKAWADLTKRDFYEDVWREKKTAGGYRVTRVSRKKPAQEDADA